MTDSLLIGLVIMVAAGTAVALGFWLDSRMARRGAPAKASLFSDSGTGAVFLFDGDVLVDCSPAGRAILKNDAAQSGDSALSGKTLSGKTSSGPWAQLMAYLSPRFDGLEEKFASLGEVGHLVLASSGARKILLTAETRGGLTRISLVDAEQEDRLTENDPMIWRALSEELEQLRGAVGEAPILMWRERPDGAVTWANTAYVMALAERLDPGEDFTWPLARLFGETPAPGDAAERRVLDGVEGGHRCYELHSKAQGDDRLVFALPARLPEQTEHSLNDVMTTLSKTFAHLHVGLAIFDRERRLHLFNPALSDLTGLPADFLVRRPSLTALLDAMRERNTIPEPRDFTAWRRQLIDMERAAASGHYEETWSLPGGQTYRVIGRPHPDGALALIIEDISDEVSRARRDRAEIELGLSVIEGLDEAVAVFSQSGQLVMSNAAYARLWGHDLAATPGAETLGDQLARWKVQAAPTPLWGELADMAAAPAERQVIRADLRLADGRLISSHFKPLEGGATMAAFSVIPSKTETRAVWTEERLRA